MYHRTREPWHAMKPAEVERRLKTNSTTGLSYKVCRTRLERFGKNDLFLPEPRTAASCIRRILTDTSLLVLALVAVLALFFSRFATALTVLFVLAVSCLVSVIAYIKTCRIKETMSACSEPHVRLLRGNSVLLCSASEVVPGDILLLNEGDIVPCDARLISSTSDFCVLTYLPDKEAYDLTYKNAYEVYDTTSPVPPLARVNMVYTASVVHGGSAKAIVTETGSDTYIGDLMGPHPFPMQVGDPSYLIPMRKYTNRYSLVMCLLILPVTLIGIFAGRGTIDILDVLLLTLSLVSSSMSEQVLSMGRIICAASVIRASLDGNQENAAVIKNYRAIDALSGVDELFLFGRSAVSDGCLHPYAVYTFDGLQIGQNMKTPAVRELCEMVYYYESCATCEEYADRFQQNDAWQSSVRELFDMVAFDRSSARIRTVSLRPLEYSTAWVEVTLRQSGNLPDRHFRIHRCDEPEPLLQCNARRGSDGIVSLDTAQCKVLFDIFCQLKNQGTEVCAYIREEGGVAVFEGLLSFREAYAPDIPDMLREMQQNHVRVSLFLPEEGKCHLNYLIASGWIESGKDAVSASKLHTVGKTLDEVFDKKRVFFGFSEDQIAEQITRCRSRGKITASMGLRYGDSPMMTPANVCISCENRFCGSENGVSRFEIRKTLSAEECDQSVRRNADVLVRRAGARGGGLAGIANAVTTARAIHFRMMLAMQYLLVAQMLRMTMVVLPLLFGYTMISPALLLISGVWVDLGFVLVCAFHHCSPDVLREPPDYRRFFKEPLRARPDWQCAALICGVFTVLTGLILSGTQTAVCGDGLEIYMFLSLLASQTCLLICLMRTTGVFSSRWQAHASSLIVFGVLLALIVPIVLIYPLSAWFGGAGISLFLFILSLLSPLYLVGSYFLSMTYRKRIARLFRIYFHGIRRHFGKKIFHDAYNGDKGGKKDR